MSSDLPLKFDSRAPAVLQDPYPVYRELRESGGLSRGGPGQWVVSRYDDVAPLLRDRRLSHEYPEEYHEFSTGEGPAQSFFQRILLDRDAPDHTRLRRLMAQAFSPRLLQRMHGYIERRVDELLRPALDRGTFDAVTELAFPLPVSVVCELVGIPPVDRDLVRPYAIDLAKAFALYVPEEDRAAAHRAVAWLREYIGALLRERRASLGDDLLSRMIVAEDSERPGDRLTAEEIVDNTVFLFFAGFETTTNLIATGVAALLGHPGEAARLRREPGLLPAAVEEFLRFDAPIQATARLVREPVEVCGRTVRAGRVLVLLLGSANHDERRFADPERLDVGRTPNPHLSFGGGSHHCLGAHLARIEGQAAIGWLLRHAPVLEAADEVVRRPSVTFRTFRSVPVALG
ncbi:cytochrome P450 [Streptomyces capoamus]|uniref:Cytochrome P450 n=1 Tax=Streptomyces capoamus TaxID=68183 RepID=A0A919EY68_9ACTN|nr:cytochrome P450 [Streptomyces libani subsp. rufus]GHG57615.1 cytochrome P450 [Streptomyces capoamus]